MAGGHMNEHIVYPMTALLIASVYLLYVGLSAFLVSYIQKGHAGVWKEANVFVLRQISSKIKTMQFTLGTLTLLFMVALLGASHALMLNEYQNTQSNEKWPFDIAIYHEEPNYDFSKEIKLLQDKTKLASKHVYQIYENNSDDFSEYMKHYYTDILNNSVAGDGAYFKHDTYMKLSDYNRLREMLGHKKAALERDQYLIQIKGRLFDAASRFSDQPLKINGTKFECGGIRTEAFEQNGHNGADYLLVVPDQAVDSMKPYYSLLMAQVKGSVPKNLKLDLEEIAENDTKESTADTLSGFKYNEPWK